LGVFADLGRNLYWSSWEFHITYPVGGGGWGVGGGEEPVTVATASEVLFSASFRNFLSSASSSRSAFISERCELEVIRVVLTSSAFSLSNCTSN